MLAGTKTAHYPILHSVNSPTVFIATQRGNRLEKEEPLVYSQSNQAWRVVARNQKMKQFALLLLSISGLTSGLDLQFDSIQCDTKLPAYAKENGISLTCNGSTRCQMGDSAMISGEIIYNGLSNYNLYNNSGYVSSKLQLMTIEYDLFDFLPFKFCGDWIMDAAYNYQECPDNGTYHFEIPYQLPETEGVEGWFATGWQGVSYVKIYREQSDESTKLAQCKLHFRTYVTDAGVDNWYALPSAAQATIIVFGVLGLLFMIVLCLACRPRRKHPTDDDYATNFKSLEDQITETRSDDGSLADKDKKATSAYHEDHHEKARRIAGKMRYHGT